MRESFISIKVCRSKRKERKKEAEKLREDPYRKKLFECIRKKLEESQVNKSIDSIPYDAVLNKISHDNRKYTRFEAFLKFETEDKEVVPMDDDYAVEWKDKDKGKFYYSKPGEWIEEKGVVEDKY
jgi:hypothetical protein